MPDALILTEDNPKGKAPTLSRTNSEFPLCRVVSRERRSGSSGGPIELERKHLRISLEVRISRVNQQIAPQCDRTY